MQLTGSYSFFNGFSVGSFVCSGSSEKPQWGVGCSTGPGVQWKVLPTWSKTPDFGTSTICQMQPFAVSPTCVAVEVFVRRCF